MSPTDDQLIALLGGDPDTSRRIGASSGRTVQSGTGPKYRHVCACQHSSAWFVGAQQRSRWISTTVRALLASRSGRDSPTSVAAVIVINCSSKLQQHRRRSGCPGSSSCSRRRVNDAPRRPQSVFASRWSTQHRGLSSSLSCCRSRLSAEVRTALAQSQMTVSRRSGTGQCGLGKRVGFTPSRVRISHPPLLRHARCPMNDRSAEPVVTEDGKLRRCALNPSGSGPTSRTVGIVRRGWSRPRRLPLSWRSP